MKFTYYGHSCFSVEINSKKLLFDPFITGNELAKNIKLADIDADYILQSHGHADHIADCISIAQATGAKVVQRRHSTDTGYATYSTMGKTKFCGVAHRRQFYNGL